MEHGNALRRGAGKESGGTWKNFRKQRASARAINQPRFKIRNERNRYTEIKRNKQRRKRNEAEEYQMENENKIVYQYLPISQVQAIPWECVGNTRNVPLGNTLYYGRG